jgi:hypothetical protein
MRKKERNLQDICRYIDMFMTKNAENFLPNPVQPPSQATIIKYGKMSGKLL